MSERYYILTDVNGVKVCVDTTDLYCELQAQDFTIFGLSMSAIVELKKQYELKNGILPITTESIKEVFGNE
jgi:hypothetical protein